MNIRVDLNTPIKDGTEVVFRSPVDCSQVTGLKVYHIGADGNTTSQEFMFADAHGNNVGDIDHLFAENVVVKVILDVATSMAFVQNADTNAYLENKFMETIGKCCSSFTESGGVVSCNPVEDYPLNVVSHIEPVQSGSGDPTPENVRPITGWEQVTVRRNGKNLFNADEIRIGAAGGGKITTEGDVITCNFVSGGIHFYNQFYPAGTYTLSVISDDDFAFTAYVYRKSKISERIAYKYMSAKAKTFTFTADEAFRLSFGGSVTSTSSNLGTYTFRLQLEAGTTATEYEPYRGEEITLDLGQTVYGGNLDWKTGVLTITKGNIESYAGEDVPDGWVSSTGELSTGAQVVYPIAEPIAVQLTPQEILGLSGTNTLYSDTGDTDISGKADPTAVIEKLTNAIIALGGNV